MGILSIIILLVIVGVVLYLLETLVPMSPPVKTAIRVLAGLGIFLYILQCLGLVHTNIHL